MGVLMHVHGHEIENFNGCRFLGAFLEGAPVGFSCASVVFKKVFHHFCLGLDSNPNHLSARIDLEEPNAVLILIFWVLFVFHCDGQKHKDLLALAKDLTSCRICLLCVCSY